MRHKKEKTMKDRVIKRATQMFQACYNRGYRCGYDEGWSDAYMNAYEDARRCFEGQMERMGEYINEQEKFL